MIRSVRVAIVTFNNARVIQRCLDKLAAQTWRDFEAVVVDNASSDGTADMLRLPDDRFKLVRSNVNLGFAGGNNLAAADCRSGWLATLNPDAFAEETWLARLMDAAARHPDRAMFGSTQVMDSDPGRIDGAGDCYSIGGLMWRSCHGAPTASLTSREYESFAPCAAAALWRTADFQAVGGFDDRFFCYCEDIDLAFRLRLNGCRGLQVPAAVVRHEGYSSTSRYGDFAVYHGLRNMVWVFAKNMPGPLLPIAIPAHLATVGALVVRHSLAGRGGVAVKAVIDAIRNLRPMVAGRRPPNIPTSAITDVIAWNPIDAILRRPAINLSA